MKEKLKRLLKTHKRKLHKLEQTARYAVIASLILVLSIQLPSLHYSYIRSSVAKKTVMITNQAGNSGGTGVHVKAASGVTYILTNDHICELANESGLLYIKSDENSRSLPRKVLERSDSSDLCLVEPLPGVEGLSLGGKEPQSGDTVAVIGHPQLMPTTMSKGEIIASVPVMIYDHLMDENDPKDTCNLPKNKIAKVPLFGIFMADACFISIEANMSNVIILPGNSGSPVVNFFGNIVGLVFAGNRANWGVFIKLKDIQTFLKPY